MNRKGMTAFVDAMIFLIIMMMAISAAVMAHGHQSDPGLDPEMFMDALPVIEVRLSDFTDLEDDSLVYLIDVMAYSADRDCSVDLYLESILDDLYGKGRYLLEYSCGDTCTAIGKTDSMVWSESSREVRTSLGETVHAVLHLA